MIDKNIKIINGSRIEIRDSMGGFDYQYFSQILNDAVELARKNKINNVQTSYIFDNRIKDRYLDIKFSFKLELVGGNGWELLNSYKTHPSINFKNFISSFNGAPHVGRKLLVATLEKFGFFDAKYCSKNFSFTQDVLEGHIRDYTLDYERFYRKFFISGNEQFYQKIYNLNQYIPTKTTKINIYEVENSLVESFLHIVSETMPTNCYPWVTEKVLLPIVTRSLFLSWAPPGYHSYFEKYFGFRKYNKIFDYKFDEIQNPVERLVELMSMISKFSVLSPIEWHDLYEMEIDTIEYNYNHYFSQSYIKHLEQFS